VASLEEGTTVIQCYQRACGRSFLRNSARHG